MRASSPDQMVINLAGYARNGYMISQFRVRVIEMTSTLTSHAPWLIASHPVSEGLIVRTHPVPRTTADANADIAEREARRNPAAAGDVSIGDAGDHAPLTNDTATNPDAAAATANASADDVTMTAAPLDATTGSATAALGDSA